MLKLSTLILGTFVSLSTFASTHGGGVLMNAMNLDGNGGGGTMNALLGSGGGGAVLSSTNGGGPIATKEIIFNMGQKDGFVKFAYGQLIENKWQIEKLELPTQEILKDEEVFQALKMSEAVQNWAPIK